MHDKDEICHSCKGHAFFLKRPCNWSIKSMDKLEFVQPKISILEKSCYATTTFDVFFLRVMETQDFGN